MVSFKLFLLFALIAAACAYSIPDGNLYVPLEAEYPYQPEGILAIGDDFGHQMDEDLFRVKRQDRGSVSIGAERDRHGTKLSAEAQARLWQSQNGRSQLDANANYNRQFGAGRSRPDYGAGVTFRHRF